MLKSQSHDEWKQYASKADELEGLDLWRATEASRDYDYRMIRARLDSLRSYRPDDPDMIMFLLRAGMIRNLGGICHSRLYRYSRVGTKHLIEEYIAETQQLFTKIASLSHPEIGSGVKTDFFGDLLRGFGRTALILHGGASFGLCHLGVTKSLHEQGLLPKIVCGVYIGAVMAAAICVQDEAGLRKLFTGDSLDLRPFDKPGGVFGSFLRKAFRLLRYRRLLDVRVVEEAARRNIGNITFKEAFVKSSRILNIIVQCQRKNEVPVLLNYLTAPDVVVWSAACASCAVPGIYGSVTLYSKCPDTGAIQPWHPSTVRMESAFVSNEIPTTRLAELFNVNSFIVSQVPSYFSIQISPSDEAEKSSFSSQLIRLIGDELAHRYHQLKALGLVPEKLAYLERFFHAPLPGDVTLSPTIHFSDIVHIIRNPTCNFVHYCLRKGERSVWKRMAQIKIRSILEYDLERILDELKFAQNSKQTGRGSVDSVAGERPTPHQLVFRTRSFEL